MPSGVWPEACEKPGMPSDAYICTKTLGSQGSAQGNTGGAYSIPPGSLADGEGASCLLPENPTSALGLSGLATSAL